MQIIQKFIEILLVEYFRNNMELILFAPGTVCACGAVLDGRWCSNCWG
jgi:hypothetical protein